jgi:hypothetical protein
MVEGRIHAQRSESPYARGEVWSVVVNRVDPKGTECVVVSDRGSTDDPDSGV